MSLSRDTSGCFTRKTAKSREDVGLRLGRLLERFRSQEGIVYALPDGGIVLGHRVARFLNLPLTLMPVLDVFHPFNPKYAIGAVAEDGHRIINNADEVFIEPDRLESRIYETRNRAKRYRETYLQGREMRNPKGKIALLVGEDFSNENALLLAMYELMHFCPEKIVLALPIAPYQFVNKIEDSAVDCLTLEMPPYYSGNIKEYYDTYHSIGESEIIKMFEETRAPKREMAR